IVLTWTRCPVTYPDIALTWTRFRGKWPIPRKQRQIKRRKESILTPGSQSYSFIQSSENQGKREKDEWSGEGGDRKKSEHLLALDGAKERLRLFKAQLLDEGAFDSVVDGCVGVFHTASPFYHNIKDPQAEMLDPAVKGTLNVLRSCAKVPSIKRVVITSSIAATVFNGRPLGPDVVVDETWFSDPAFCEKSKLWYMLSKTLAEEAAWKFAKENGIDMVTINPGLVIGPLLQPTVNTSVEPILKLIN
ncbi:hypothetical protein Goari_019358, partial [Gossypium aridum]|nr:hypothetical protein [Gossypium aridum]